jgi:hypothetical protein
MNSEIEKIIKIRQKIFIAKCARILPCVFGSMMGVKMNNPIIIKKTIQPEFEPDFRLGGR